MRAFERISTDKWKKETPGSRWYKADLHLHTLDDHPNPNLKWPDGCSGDASDSNVQNQYAKAFLKGAIDSEIEVLGLTPHAVRSGDGDDSCATWKIVECWNTENDDDGIPFREKIFAIFPGFEINANDGQTGIHLCFIFDPEISRERYLKLFDTAMGAITPYNGNELEMSPKSPEEIFSAINDLRIREGDGWNYLCFAPHFHRVKGLFKELKSQRLQYSPIHQSICALELGDNNIPSDETSGNPWLVNGMKKYRHCFIHTSDAYKVNNTGAASHIAPIGNRFTFVKLATPTIESLRQSFLASDSRTRIAYDKDSTGNLIPASDLPDPYNSNRPWLRKISISGGGSFFGGFNNVKQDGDAIQEERKQTFHFSPDLTCIIGGRMSGKSTILDGLRVFFGHDLPSDDYARKDVNGRAKEKFLYGSPTVEKEVGGKTNPSKSLKEQWPAKFFTQRELRNSIEDQESMRDLLFSLIPEKVQELKEMRSSIEELDIQIGKYPEDLKTIREEYEGAETEYTEAKSAKEELDKFKELGIEDLIATQDDQSSIENLHSIFTSISTNLNQLVDIVNNENSLILKNQVLKNIVDQHNPNGLWSTIQTNISFSFTNTIKTTDDAVTFLSRLNTIASGLIQNLEEEVEKKFIEAGRNPEEKSQFDELTKTASKFETAKAAFIKNHLAYANKLKEYYNLISKRDSKVEKVRKIMAVVFDSIFDKFKEKIKVEIRKNAVSDEFAIWIRNLSHAPTTKWWKKTEDVAGDTCLSPSALFDKIEMDKLIESPFEMTETLSTSFLEKINDQNLIELLSLRCEDKYIISFLVDKTKKVYREMSKLSGGQQVSLLLSLILETNDSSPLVIDQPEDEIDKEYLFDTLLPLLKKLKGKRQIIFATHDANIVVNGDSDQVIYLKATNDQGRIEEQGTIDEKPIKDAILNTLDGGEIAFSLRKAKYGF